MKQCAVCGSEFSGKDSVCPSCASGTTGIGGAGSDESDSETVASQNLIPDEASVAQGGVSLATGVSESTRAPARLILRRGGALTDEVFAIHGPCVIGRFSPDSGPVDIDMGSLPESAYISRRHAELTLTGDGQWMIRDVGSRNGTFVRMPGETNYRRVIEDHPVSDHDEIALGNACFEFCVH